MVGERRIELPTSASRKLRLATRLLPCRKWWQIPESNRGLVIPNHVLGLPANPPRLNRFNGKDDFIVAKRNAFYAVLAGYANAIFTMLDVLPFDFGKGVHALKRSHRK